MPQDLEHVVLGRDVLGGLPEITTLKDGGTRTRTSLVIQLLKIAVVPTPNATAPMAPA